MNQQAAKRARNASTAVLYPIAGMMVGLIVGGVRAIGRGPDEIAQLACVLKWGITGFFTGLAFVVLLAFSSRGQGILSMRRLMVLVVVAAFLAWFFARILFGAIGYGGF